MCPLDTYYEKVALIRSNYCVATLTDTVGDFGIISHLLFIFSAPSASLVSNEITNFGLIIPQSFLLLHRFPLIPLL